MSGAFTCTVGRGERICVLAPRLFLHFEVLIDLIALSLQGGERLFLGRAPSLVSPSVDSQLEIGALGSSTAKKGLRLAVQRGNVGLNRFCPVSDRFHSAEPLA